MSAALLYLAPWLALLIVLACGHYPGERLLEAIVRTRHAPHRDEGGALLALALAGRGPPL